jgi:molybdate transport system ATP-binding protein
MSFIDISLQKTLHSDSGRFNLNISFSADSRRIVLLGPSGAGKSLTLRLIAGLVRPDAGHILINGRAYFDKQRSVYVPARERHLGYVFQDYALFPHLTVSQNIAFGLKKGLVNPSKKSQCVTVLDWINKFELKGIESNYPHQISGGQKQRVALARALVSKPTLLLLDEPFSALDQALRKRLRAELSGLQAELNIPIITITHDPDDASALGEVVIQLDGGRVVSS